MEHALHQDRTYTLHLHHRLLQGDPRAPSELMECMYEPLVRRLANINPTIWRIDETIIIDAVVDALSSYIKRPEQFQPERSALFTYLAMSAQGDLRNTLARLRRERARLVSLDPVVHDHASGNDSVDSSGAVPVEELSLSARVLCQAVMQVRRALHDSREQEVLDLIIEGERRTEMFARVLQLEGMAPAEQVRAVKRVKDRIKRRIIRRYDALRGRTAKV